MEKEIQIAKRRRQGLGQRFRQHKRKKECKRHLSSFMKFLQSLYSVLKRCVACSFLVAGILSSSALSNEARVKPGWEGERERERGE